MRKQRPNQCSILSKATQPERRELWDLNPGSGFKVCTFNSYTLQLPEPQAPSQPLPGSWVSFPQLLSLARMGTGWLISYHQASRHLESSQVRSGQSAQPRSQAGGEKEWGGGGGGDPSHWLPRHDITRGWVVGKQTSPSPSYIHPPGGGSHRGEA